MSDQKTKKKNKKKKLSSNTDNSQVPNIQSAEIGPSADKIESINQVILPQKVGMTAMFKDIEVTLTEMEKKNEVTNGTSKKKKKKKKQQKVSPNTPLEATDNEKLLSFNKDHIELINHPEISVTINTLPVHKTMEINSSEKQINEVTEDTKVVSKKKKKKKKKKNVQELSVNASNNSDDMFSNAPTCVKLPSAGDTCVLLVSHESFSNANNVVSDSIKDKKVPIEKPATVLIKNKDKVISNKSLIGPLIQESPSLSIVKVNNEEVVLSTMKTTESHFKKADEYLENENKKTATSESSDLHLSNVKEDVKTKAQLKAERRALQDSQRAAKLNKNSEKESVAQNTTKIPQNKVKLNSKESPPFATCTPSNTDHFMKIPSKALGDDKVVRKDLVFSHLPQFKDSLRQFNLSTSRIHPAILELGSHYNQNVLCGSNARCVGFLAAFKEVILDFKVHPNKVFSRDLEEKLQSYLNFLKNCRTLPVNIYNVVKVLKQHITSIPEGTDYDTGKKSLCNVIDNFVEDHIVLAMKAICISATNKIVNGDTILVFAYSSLVRDVLCNAHDEKKSFHVIVVDSRPKMEGREMLRRLVKHGLNCSYILIGAVSYVMKKVSKVIIGAHALLSNGWVISRLGSKQIALIASAFSVPVLVCCETYKFWERALTDSIVHNELGNSNDLLKKQLRNNENLHFFPDLAFLQILNILYDVTPSDLISVVITEKGLLPCTSVPVVLRVKHAGSKNSGLF